MRKEWVLFVSSMEDIVDGEENIITIRDLSPGPKKYNAKVVRAQVSSKIENLEDPDTLWIRTWIGHRLPEPWAIKIVEEVGDYLPGVPHGETLKMLKNT